MDEPRSIQVLRDALLKLGLSDDEVQRFLTILGLDLHDSQPDESTIQRICEEFAKSLPNVDTRFGGRSTLAWKMTKIIGGGLALGVLGNLFYDLIEAGFEKLMSHETGSANELAFAGGFILQKKSTTKKGLPYVVRGLKKVRQRLRMSAARTAKACAIDRETYARAERGYQISEKDAERIKAGIGVLMATHGLSVE